MLLKRSLKQERLTNKNRRNLMNSDLKSKLEILASNYSKPFCYSCHQVCPNGRCQSCGSDDLMRSTPNGCEYGLDWVINEILNEKLVPVNTEEAFEESVRSKPPTMG